jgi:hypothetical protein
VEAVQEELSDSDDEEEEGEGDGLNRLEKDVRYALNLAGHVGANLISSSHLIPGL